MVITNPDGYNQHVANPKQILFLEAYFNEDSETFGNARQSAIKAGFSESYADQIMSRLPTWFTEKVKDAAMLAKAENNLVRFLGLDESDNGKLKVKADITKFVAERLNKKKYSQRVENDVQVTKTLQGFIYEPPEPITIESQANEQSDQSQQSIQPSQS